ncbi:hypothetical protein EJV47_09045 [Hymenobacter gummosus]|uniref:Lipoprotein n=1 Tax=Hymenobacter gummosus TaxID=1776032 RepID=A0A3S0JBB1_9BACT|nr:hypothetical protein [Hymenobacter gummosus]RTQ50764.1 hypothetical protein EJV47_09045 [Hymenobacter gummosus]
MHNPLKAFVMVSAVGLGGLLTSCVSSGYAVVGPPPPPVVVGPPPPAVIVRPRPYYRPRYYRPAPPRPYYGPRYHAAPRGRRIILVR